MPRYTKISCSWLRSVDSGSDHPWLDQGRIFTAMVFCLGCFRAWRIFLVKPSISDCIVFLKPPGNPFFKPFLFDSGPPMFFCLERPLQHSRQVLTTPRPLNPREKFFKLMDPSPWTRQRPCPAPHRARPLNHHLARIGKVPSLSYPNCGASYKTVHHFILMCLAYCKERWRMQMKIGARRMRLEHLLMNVASSPALRKLQ